MLETGANPATAEFQENMTDLRENVGGAMRDLKDTATALKQDVANLAASAGAVAQERVDPLLNYIRDYPVRSMLIAAGVGMALGTMMKWRS